MRRYLLSVTLLVTLIVSLAITSMHVGGAPPVATVAVEPTWTHELVCRNFTINLTVADAQDIQRWQANITFDPAILEAVSASEGEFLKSEGYPTDFTFDISADHVYLNATYQTFGPPGIGVNGSGILGNVTFHAKGTGTTPLHLQGPYTTLTYNDTTGPASQPRILQDGFFSTPTATVAVEPTLTQELPCRDFTINLTVAGAVDIQRWEASVTFDPAVLEVVSASEGEFLKRRGYPTDFAFDISSDYVYLNATYQVFGSPGIGVTGSGILGNVTFHVTGDGTTPLDLEEVYTSLSYNDTTGPASQPRVLQDGFFTNVATVAVEPPWNYESSCTEFTVNLTVADALDIQRWEANITFDPAVLEAVSASEGEFLKRRGYPTDFAFDISSDYVYLNATYQTFGPPGIGVTGDGQLANITFHVKALAHVTGTTPLPLDEEYTTLTYNNGTVPSLQLRVLQDGFFTTRYTATLAMEPVWNYESSCTEFTVNLTVTDAVDIQLWEANITFDPTILEVVGVSEGGFVKSGAPLGITQFSWSIRAGGSAVYIGCSYYFVDYPGKGVTGNTSQHGILASVTFHVKSEGATPMHFDEVYTNLGYNNGTDIGLQPLIRHDGFFTILGDLDCDGDVNSSDLDILVSSYGTTVGDPSHYWLADLDSDDDVDASDLYSLARNYGKSVGP